MVLQGADQQAVFRKQAIIKNSLCAELGYALFRGSLYSSVGNRGSGVNTLLHSVPSTLLPGPNPDCSLILLESYSSLP